MRDIDLLALLDFARRNVINKTAFALVQSQATPHGVDGSMTKRPLSCVILLLDKREHEILVA